MFSSALLVQRVLGMKCILCLTFTTWLLWWVIRLKISIMMLNENITVSTSMCERSLPKSTIFQMFDKHYRHLQTVKSSQGLVAINLQRNLFILIVAWWFFVPFGAHICISWWILILSNNPDLEYHMYCIVMADRWH